ncbi:MAG: hypothetical protein K0S08_218 [Gammaproteobacteria bacterium]|nr:hypothetical protein [Gammaproteobacteria bacterium]
MPKTNITHEQARELVGYAVLQKDSPYHRILERFMASPEDARIIAREMVAIVRPVDDAPIALTHTANEQWLYNFMGRHSQHFVGILPITQKEASGFFTEAMFKNNNELQSFLERFMVDEVAAKTIAAAIHEFLNPKAASTSLSLVNPVHYQWLSSFMAKHAKYFLAEDMAKVSKRAGGLAKASVGAAKADAGHPTVAVAADQAEIQRAELEQLMLARKASMAQADSIAESRNALHTAAAEEIGVDVISVDQRRLADAAAFAAMRTGQDSFFGAAARRAGAAMAATQASEVVQAEKHEVVEQRSETAAKL